MTEPAAAAFLSDVSRYVHLTPFLDRECTLSGAARELGIALNRLHYWVRRMLELDLIQVVRAEPRAGRPIRHYRSTAPSFFVPFAATPAESLESQLLKEELARQRQLSLAQARAIGQLPFDRGVLFRRTADGTFSMGAHPRWDPDGVTFSAWADRSLSPAQARALRVELQALIDRYAALPEEGEAAGRFMLRAALSPL